MSYRRRDKPKKSIRQTNKPFKGISLEQKNNEIKKNNLSEANSLKRDRWYRVRRKFKRLKGNFKGLNFN